MIVAAFLGGLIVGASVGVFIAGLCSAASDRPYEALHDRARNN